MHIDLEKIHALNEAEIGEILIRYGKNNSSAIIIAYAIMVLYGIALGLILGWWIWS